MDPKSHDTSQNSAVSQETQRCLELILQRPEETPAKVIILVGRLGVGKTSLLEDLANGTGFSHGVTDTGTDKFQLSEASIDGAQYFIMDTPGLDAGIEADTFREIIRGIQAILPNGKIVGVLYVSKINQVRTESLDTKVLDFVLGFCGDAYIPNLAFVTTHWTAFYARQVTEYNEKLQKLQDLWRGRSSTGQVVSYQHGRDYNTGGEDNGAILDWYSCRQQTAAHARAFISRHYQDAGDRPLKIVQELRANIPMHLTSAGKALGLRGPSVNAGDPEPSTSRSRRDSSPPPPRSTSARDQSEEEQSGTGPSHDRRPAGRGDNGSEPSFLSQVAGGAWSLAKTILGNVQINADFGSNTTGPRWSAGSQSGGFGPTFRSQTTNFRSDRNSVVDTMKANGLDSSFQARQRFAEQYNINAGPAGSASQNTAINRFIQNRSV